ncbi:Unknown protein [Striga hermonthica]|uniref:F-box associated beta-propeller type 3 domain-containing protein n=1 Tax=Striga hermonthica TaxID=68872 RepID=A0A9N7NDH6_STRHE|nr:Unknown protein [Striga hermonthica]
MAEKKKSKSMGVGVEVYSANSDSWKKIELGFRFKVRSTKNNAIVNGNPYWVAKIDEEKGVESILGEALVCFDVTKMVFKILPLSGFSLRGGAEVPLVDWKGSLGAIVCDKNFERVESLDVWVLDESEKIWTKNHTFGPIELKVDRILQCSNNGMILGECPDGKLFVLDPLSGSVEEIVIDEAQKRSSFVIYGYTESLACVEGMEKVVVKKEVEEEKYEDEDGENSEEGPDINIASLLAF